MFYEFYNYIKNKYFDELKDQTAPMREAMIFRKTLEEIPISIKGDDYFAGWYGCEDEEATKYQDKDEKNFKYYESFSNEDIYVLSELRNNFSIGVGDCRGHICCDYAKVLNFGLNGYIETVKAELEKNPDTDKKEMLEAMLFSLESVSIYTTRFSRLAEENAKLSKNEEDTKRLLKISNTLNKIPMNSAENFYEAISAVWIMHSLMPISDKCWASISLGRFDQYMYPFYKKSLESGVSKADIKAYIKSLFLLLNNYGDGACALNIGGMDDKGNDEMNDLSRLLIEIEKELRLCSPILVARINPKTDENILDEFIDLKLFSMGQPTFYGEIPCRNAMINRGVGKTEAIDFSVNSCMGLFAQGKEIASMWGCEINMHLPLELSVNFGEPIFSKLPFELEEKTDKEPENLEELFENYEKNLKMIMKRVFSINRKVAKKFAENSPNPLLSAMTEGCIESGLDRSIGAKYNTETVETFALINTGDAICAINELVFCRKKYTLSQLKEAVLNNYAGADEILKDIKKCGKYGAGSKEADEICRRLCMIAFEICNELSYDNIRFLPSLHTLDKNVYYGLKMSATFDGRLKGEPVNKNAGPSNAARNADPTSLVLSAAALNQELYSGGQPIDVYFDRAMLTEKEQRDKIKTLIKTYFKLGGLQFQVNCVEIEMLEKAYENPKEYPNIIVRIGGYSRRFTELDKVCQREFIERFKKERGE